MAARPPTIGDLTDELLLCIFAALPTERMHDRCVLPCVCRRWRAVTASPAAAPVWARVEVSLRAGPAAQVQMLRWLPIHGPHLRQLELTATSDAGLGSAEWWRHLGRGLTRLRIYGHGSAVLARAHEHGGLPASLLELEVVHVLGGGPNADLPRALGALSRLTFLRIFDSDCTPAAGEAPWRPLRGLAALRRLELNMRSLEELPAALGALTALTSAEFNCHHLRGTLEPLAPLTSSLRRLTLHPARVPRPSALTALTALEELSLVFGEEDEYVVPADLIVLEPGAHLHRLRKLSVTTVRDDDDALVDVQLRLVEPLRAAAALEFCESTVRLSPVILTPYLIDDLLAGKPALRRFALQIEHALERDFDLAALRARHPAVEFALSANDGFVYY